MRSALYTAAAALPIAAQAFDVPDDNRFVQDGGLIRFPLNIKEGTTSTKGVTKRMADGNLTPQQSGTFYSIDLVIGTPGQTVSVNFDTGSDELWVNPICSKSYNEEFCNSFGRFSESDTYNDLNKTTIIRYGTGYAELEYGYDYVSIGGARINQQIFGAATDSEFAVTGIMGAGPSLDGWENSYPLIIDNLATQGLINSRAFSLDIREFGSSRGAVVYGGIDTKKFSGKLEKRPIIPASSSPDGLTRYWINLDGISVVTKDGEEVEVFHQTNGLPVLLDSGYTLSALPGPIFEGVLANFPSATPVEGTDQYEVDCSITKSDGSMEFLFGETTISVPFADFVWHNSDNVCYLGVFQDDDFTVLGDTFLRAAYVVYDWDNRNIHLANNEDCGSNLMAIGQGPNAVPSVVGDCGKPAPTTTTTTSAATSTTTKQSTTSKQSTTTKVSTTSKQSTTTKASTTTTSKAITTAHGNSTTIASTQTSHRGNLTTSATGKPTTHSSGSSKPTTLTSSSGKPTTTALTTSAVTTSGKSNSTTSAKGPTGPVTSTVKVTQTHTITSCAPTVTDCPVGSVTTEVITSYTTWCPESTGTFVLPTSKCVGLGCKPATETVTETAPAVITVHPITTQTTRVPVPTCPVTSTPSGHGSNGGHSTHEAASSTRAAPTTKAAQTSSSDSHPKPTPSVTSSVHVPANVTTMMTKAPTPCSTCGPTGGNSTVTSPPVVTAGASEMGRASGFAVALVAVMAAMMM